MPASTGKIYLGSNLIASGADASGWVRPSDWLLLPDWSAQEGFVALCAVHETDPNQMAMQMAGAYTVDWGDGSAPVNYASNTIAEKELQWTDYPSSSLSSRGYRQAIVKVTPQAGQQITQCIPNVRYSTAPARTINPSSPILDIIIRGPNMTNCRFGGDTNFSFAAARNMERAQILHLGSVTNLGHAQSGTGGAFFNCYALQSVSIADTGGVTLFRHCFNTCQSLKVAPPLNTQNATDVNRMFLDCSSLKSVPAYDFGEATSMVSTFQNCRSLRLMQPINAPKVTNMTDCWAGCASLEELPMITLGAVTNLSTAFAGMVSLRTIPAWNVATVTTAASLFSNTSIPNLRSVKWVGLNISHSYGTSSSLAGSLQAAALDEVYTNLSATGAGKTITVTGNPGTATDNPSIATAKGWTVTG
jgi:hypothetical protein